jgi:hypothetical protein
MLLLPRKRGRKARGACPAALSIIAYLSARLHPYGEHHKPCEEGWDKLGDKVRHKEGDKPGDKEGDNSPPE